ncbi:hypothetical protein JCM30237_28800 [Halolamina litorea]|uniref:Uncharacterized protein n=1 Tax=Halolamina litorea TaxID=1515593 RepID=A0ABD6BU15_9EURY|nr:hypothetical protein [Halolamina litorea]
MTDNHSYNTPTKGATEWHAPLNDNFERLDGDVEVRDREANRGDYVAKAGAKFFATDTGAAYIGDGSNWNRLATTGENPTFNSLRVENAPSSNKDVVRQSELSDKADSVHSHSGDDISPNTVSANRVEADTVVASDAGTTVWGAYGQSIPSGTQTTIEFQNVETDQRSQWDSSNYTVEVTEPGNYLVSGGVFWRDEPSSGTNHWFTIKRNDNIGVAQAFAQGPNGLQLQASRPVLGVGSGDSFHLEVEQYEDSQLRIGGSRVSTYLSVVQL